MKKYASLLILTALLLTGCGSTAGTAENASSPKDSVAVEESNSETEKEESSSDQTANAAESDAVDSEAAESGQNSYVYTWNDIDIPIPSELQEDSYNSLTLCFNNIPIDQTVENPVYFSIDYIYPKVGEDGTYPTYTTEELPDVLEDLLHRNINGYYVSDKQYSKKTVESALTGTFLGEEATGEKGTIVTADGTKLHYVAYYVFMELPSAYPPSKVPLLWVSFTPSDDKDALNLMERAAEGPLKEAKVHVY